MSNSPFVKLFEISLFAPSESELNVEFSIELLFCPSIGAWFSLIDSCDEFSVYLWQKKLKKQA